MEQQMKSQNHLAVGHIHQTHGATGVDPRPALMQLNKQLKGKQISQTAFETRQAEIARRMDETAALFSPSPKVHLGG